MRKASGSKRTSTRKRWSRCRSRNDVRRGGRRGARTVRLGSAGTYRPVASVVAAWHTRHGGGAWHEWIGYAALTIVVVRIAWSFVGSPYARFGDFIVGPRTTLRYALQTLRGNEPRHLGHNPLGAWMIVALTVTVLVVTSSGWLYTTNRFWGVAWVEALHSGATDVLIVLAVLHVAGVLYASWRRRENLVAAMLHGRKRAETETPAVLGATTTEGSTDEKHCRR